MGTDSSKPAEAAETFPAPESAGTPGSAVATWVPAAAPTRVGLLLDPSPQEQQEVWAHGQDLGSYSPAWEGRAPTRPVEQEAPATPPHCSQSFSSGHSRWAAAAITYSPMGRHQHCLFLTTEDTEAQRGMVLAQGHTARKCRAGIEPKPVDSQFVWALHHCTRLPLAGHVAMFRWVYIKLLSVKASWAAAGSKDTQTTSSNHHQVMCLLEGQESVKMESHSVAEKIIAPGTGRCARQGAL